MRATTTILVGLVLLCASAPTLRADDSGPIAVQTLESCKASFPKRLKTTQAAIKAAAAFDQDSRRVMPWAEAHCRPMTELERVARRENDDLAIVCDTAKGRPAGLTGKFFTEHSNALQVESWDSYTEYDTACVPFDPISLDMRDLTFDRGELQARAAAAINSLSPEEKAQIIAEQERAHAGLAHAIAVKCFGLDPAKCPASGAVPAKSKKN